MMVFCNLSSKQRTAKKDTQSKIHQIKVPSIKSVANDSTYTSFGICQTRCKQKCTATTADSTCRFLLRNFFILVLRKTTINQSILAMP